MSNQNKGQEPPKGQAQQIANTPQDKEVVVKDAREVTTSTPVALGGQAPGQSQEKEKPLSHGIILEGLGSLSESDAQGLIAEDINSGDGDYVVVLHDVVTGVDKPYVKGQVRRLSHFIKDFVDETKASVNRVAAKRLFDLGSIRLATQEEKGQDIVNVDGETEALIKERMRRIQAEQQLNLINKEKQGQGAVTPSMLEKNPQAVPPSNLPPATTNWQ